MRSVGLKKSVTGDSLSALAEHRDRIREWLAEQPEDAEVEQKHLDEGSSERAYWHHGYQAALGDVLKLLRQ